ncbi:hypothetical protein KAW65_02555 [candidate division WOR-3 bacterium]|nr:hypothetical protein [candidate division WOR-3 bacterium]
MKNAFDLYPEKYDKWFDKNDTFYLTELKALKKAIPPTGKGIEREVL